MKFPGLPEEGGGGGGEGGKGGGKGGGKELVVDFVASLAKD